MMRFLGVVGVSFAILAAAGGCVERILTIDSDPAGGLVELNGQEMGRTPVSRNFTWYGVYDVTIRRSGYETLKTTAKVYAPFYEWIPLDLFAEILPIPLKDHHVISYELAPAPPASEPGAGILQRAAELKSQMEPTHYPASKPAK